jgi:hypothetical protein
MVLVEYCLRHTPIFFLIETSGVFKRQRFYMLKIVYLSLVSLSTFAAIDLELTSREDIMDGDLSSIDALLANPGNDLHITFREALSAANADQTYQDGVRILFPPNLSSPVLVSLPLPPITKSKLHILGNGAILDGSNCFDCWGLDIQADKTLVDSLTVVGFARAAVLIHGSNATENIIRNCNIGLLDRLPFPNDIGIWIQDRASYNLVEKTVISGNKRNGVVVFGPKTVGNKFLANFVGVTRDGQSTITNGFELDGGISDSVGFFIYDAPATEIGRGPDQGNIISAFHTEAISLLGDQTVGAKVRANRIELQPNVIARVPDFAVGGGIYIALGVSFIDIGGPNTEDGNYMSMFKYNPCIYVGADSSLEKATENVRISNNQFTCVYDPLIPSSSGLIIDEMGIDCSIGPGNKIHGFRNGIEVRDGAKGIHIFGNSIFENWEAGIFIDPLANGGVQPPVISAGAPYTGQTVPCGLVDFYADEGGQGRLYLGAQYADADGGFALRAPGDVPEGLNLTTIVTDRLGNSSAFSAPVPVALVARGPLEAAPALGPCVRFYYHAADPSRDYAIDLSELLRGIQLYNALAYHCDAAAEDGYAPGAGDQGCAVHTLDYNPQDWRISMSELLRAIQFYNTPGGYAPCDTGEDGFCPAMAG